MMVNLSERVKSSLFIHTKSPNHCSNGITPSNLSFGESDMVIVKSESQTLRHTFQHCPSFSQPAEARVTVSGPKYIQKILQTPLTNPVIIETHTDHSKQIIFE